MWHPQLESLCASHRVVAYDRRGFGETLPVDESFSQVGDLLAVLDHLDIPQAALVGCSQGGRIAIDFALAHPDRVRTLVLVSPAISGAPPPSSLPRAIQVLQSWLEASEKTGDLEQVNAIEAHLWLDGPLSPEGRVAGMARQLFLDMNGRALRAEQLGQEIEPAPAYPHLRQISQPTLVISGLLDWPHIRERCEHLAHTLPNAQLYPVPDAAHLPSLEHPQWFNALLKGFLASLDSLPDQ
ncbi:3-oxoadipate enol-lactonase 2 [Calidithermus terrae]|uniref:3-oxoadipate enol-lactonase 2 n=2 Tax=Calidithermus terrae TaxID=1408545 RepID=A0A399F2J9_9DEIN|nr:3-oxoadipate enol-lactonase 2 [Calidithermus terrae]